MELLPLQDLQNNSELGLEHSSKVSASRNASCLPQNFKEPPFALETDSLSIMMLSFQTGGGWTN